MPCPRGVAAADAFGGGGLNGAAKGDILFILIVEASLDNAVLETFESTD